MADVQPNIVVVICDDLAWGDLGCHGNADVHTPTLDALHAAGTRLTRYCSGPLCTPARASLMTGRYHLRTRAFDTYLGRAMLDPDERTIANVLHDAGYATGMFGKWHLGDNAPSRPHDMGFDEALYHLGGGLRQPGAIGRDSYFDPDLVHNGKRVQSRGYCTDVFTDAALDFIDRHASQPFFCFLSTNAPHTPLEIAEHLVERYRQAGLPEPTARLYAMVENIDANVGRILARLDALKLTGNTLVVFTSDHGPCAGANHNGEYRFNGGLRGGKGMLYEGGIRVPCLWKWPRRFKAGRDLDCVTSPIDVLPTLAAAAGVASPGDRVIDGENLLPLLTGQADADIFAHRSLFMQWHRGTEPRRFQNAACIQQRFKWYRPHERDDELYDLVTDPFEQHNLVARHPDRVAAMRDAYARWFEDVSNTRPDNFAPTPIRLASTDADPVLLTWQDWRPYRDEEGWCVDNPGWWRVHVPHEARFDVEVDTLHVPEPRTLHVRCGDVRMTRTTLIDPMYVVPGGCGDTPPPYCPTLQEMRGHLFQGVVLPAGIHRFEAFLTDVADRRIGVVQVRVTASR